MSLCGLSSAADIKRGQEIFGEIQDKFMMHDKIQSVES